MLNVIILSVIILSVIILSVIILSVIILSVIIVSVIILSVIILSVIILSVIILSVIILSIVILSVIILNVVTLIVVAPAKSITFYPDPKFRVSSVIKFVHECSSEVFAVKHFTVVTYGLGKRLSRLVSGKCFSPRLMLDIKARVPILRLGQWKVSRFMPWPQILG